MAQSTINQQVQNMNVTDIIDPKSVIKEILNQPQIHSFLSTLKILLIILLAAYLIFKIISWIKAGIIDRRIKNTYKNTKEILLRLEKIEKKLGIKQEKQEINEKPEKSEDKKKKK